jgi:universal stress protein A
MVPIDFSGCSKKALQYALSLAQDYHASVVLIHVVEGGSPSDQLVQDRQMELETLVRQEVRKQVPITTLVKVGEPLREIIKVAAAGFIDLLLISTHARAGLPDFCLGSAAEQIVRYAPCPVLVVREQERDFLKERKLARRPKTRMKKQRQ